MAQVVLVSNGPGELYTWVRPVLRELRASYPHLRVAISLVPCQFASGAEARIAESFSPDTLTTPAEYAAAAAKLAAPQALLEARSAAGGGVVIGLGGSAAMTAALGRRLGYPAYRYSFEPHWSRGLSGLLLPDEGVRRRALARGAPPNRSAVVGNLVADALTGEEVAAEPGEPHVLLFGGSRDSFALHLIPLLIMVADQLAGALPRARFVWPVSRLLKESTLQEGVAGRYAETLGGSAGRLVDGAVITPSGARIELVSEEERYAHMRAADLAITIPGTNTLELGIAGVPALVLLPMNRPELIPLEGAGHWLGLVPVVGKYLKRYAVKLFVEGLRAPVSLPNRISGEPLMVELTGRIDPGAVSSRAAELLNDSAGLAARRAALLAAMPRPGAAGRLLAHVLNGSGLAASGSGGAA